MDKIPQMKPVNLTKRTLSLTDTRYLIQLLLIFVLVGLHNLFLADFNVDYLYDPTFWQSTVSVFGAYILTINLAYTWTMDRGKRRNEKIVNYQNIKQSFVIEDMDTDFQDYIDLTNLENKKRAWISKIRQEMLELKSKATPIDRKLYKSKNPDDEDKRLANDYCNRMELLESQLQNEFIDENIDYLKVDYDFIDYTTITNGYQTRNEAKRKVSKKAQIRREIIFRFAYTFLYTIFLSSFTLTMKDLGRTELIYDITIKMIGLISQFISGCKYANDYLEEEYVSELEEHIYFIDSYMAWHKKRGEINGQTL